jgi:hypothetical protein
VVLRQLWRSRHSTLPWFLLVTLLDTPWIWRGYTGLLPLFENNLLELNILRISRYRKQPSISTGKSKDKRRGRNVTTTTLTLRPPRKPPCPSLPYTGKLTHLLPLDSPPPLLNIPHPLPQHIIPDPPFLALAVSKSTHRYRIRSRTTRKRQCQIRSLEIGEQIPET